MLSLSAPITSSSLNRKENKIFQKQIKVQIEGYGEHSEVLSTLSEKKKKWNIVKTPPNNYNVILPYF